MALSDRVRALNRIFETLQDLNLGGQIFDQERVKVGLGASCDVFRARLVHCNKMVAVKQFRLFLDEDLSFAKNVGRELRLWSKLKHPNILPFLGYFFEGERAIPNFVSEWMKNGTVINYMKEHQVRFTDGMEIWKMVFGIASGLLHIHTDHNIIHADLKAANILVSDDGRPLIADFGFSISSTSTSLAASSNHGQGGTIRWMAKELFSDSFDETAEGPKHTTMTDMWAFGMVIYELLTQKLPFHHIAPFNVPGAIRAGKSPREPDFGKFSKNGLSSRVLWAISLICWLDDPTKRPSILVVHKELASSMHDHDRDKYRAFNVDASSTSGCSKSTTFTIEINLEIDHSNETCTFPPVARRPLSYSTTSDPRETQDISIAERCSSSIIGFKCFKNWVKAVLILHFAEPVLRECSPRERVKPYPVEKAGRVLDIGCGRGADLGKWRKSRVEEYVGLDIAQNVLDQAKKCDAKCHYDDASHMKAKFYNMDFFSSMLPKGLDSNVLTPLFDVVSMQLCMQYAFESVQKATIALENISKCLRKGGVFISTIPNDKLLLSLLDRLPASELTFGNSVYEIRFENRACGSIFGRRYWITIKENENLKTCQEYVVHWDAFVKMASGYKLALRYKSNFHDFNAEHRDHKEYGSLLQRMNLNGKCQMDKDQWEFANLSIAFVFQKL